MLGSPIPRPSSRNFIPSRRSMSPVPSALAKGNVTDTFLQQGGPQQNETGSGAPLSGTTMTVSLPLISPAFSSSSQSDPEILKKLAGRHVINASMFTKHDLHALFNLAQAFRNAVLKDRQLENILKVSIC